MRKAKNSALRFSPLTSHLLLRMNVTAGALQAETSGSECGGYTRRCGCRLYSGGSLGHPGHLQRWNAPAPGQQPPNHTRDKPGVSGPGPPRSESALPAHGTPLRPDVPQSALPAGLVARI